MALRLTIEWLNHLIVSAQSYIYIFTYITLPALCLFISVWIIVIYMSHFTWIKYIYIYILYTLSRRVLFLQVNFSLRQRAICIKHAVLLLLLLLLGLLFVFSYFLFFLLSFLLSNEDFPFPFTRKTIKQPTWPKV